MNRPRPPWRRLVATATATAVAAVLAIAGVAAPAQAAPTKTLVVSDVVVAAETSVTVSFSGVGYDDLIVFPTPGYQPHAYVTLVEKGSNSAVQGGAIPTTLAYPSASGDISESLVVPASALTAGTEYELVAWQARSEISAATEYARTAVVIDWAALHPAPEPEPSVKTLVVSDVVVAAETSVTVSFSGVGYDDLIVFPTPGYQPHAYVTLVEKGSNSAVQGGAIPTTLAYPSASGDISESLVVPASALTAGTEYELVAWQARSEISAATEYARTAVVIDWAALHPAPEPTPVVLSVSQTTELDPAGVDITVSGSGYLPNAPATDATRRPLQGKFGGAYVEYGYYVGDVWTTLNSKWAVSAADASALGAAATPITDGRFSFVISVAPGSEAPAGAAYGFRTYSGGGSAYEPFTKFTAVAFAKPAVTPTGKTLVVSDVVVAAETSVTVSFSGVGYDDLIVFPTPGYQPHAYVTLVEKGSNSAVQGGAIPTTLAYPSASGDISESLVVPASALTAGTEYELVAWQARSEISAATEYARTPVVIDWAALHPAPEPGATVTTTRLSANASAPVEPGTKVAFTAQVSPAAAVGSVAFTLNGTAQPPVALVNGKATFSTTAVADTNLTVTATFTPRDSADFSVSRSAAVTVEVQATQSPLKVVVTPSTNLDASIENVLTVAGSGFAGPSAANGVYVMLGEKSVFTGEGALPSEGWVQQAWVPKSGFVGDSFVTSLTVAAGSLKPGTDYVVVTSAAHGLSATDRSLDTFTPVTVSVPAKPSVSLPGGTKITQGATIEIVGAGFPAQSAATAVVNSDPLTVGTKQTDADGNVSFSWQVPADFAVGSHTITISSAGVTASVPVMIEAAPTEVTEPGKGEEPAPVVDACVASGVSGATLDWGVKESFRNYISGSIAQGSYSGGWGAGSGAYRAETGQGSVAFGGSMSFTGHAGKLELTIANPRISVDGSSGVLYATVTSKEYAGQGGVSGTIALANLSLPTPSTFGDAISWSGVSATLTSAGADAFAGFYEAGSALDSLSFMFPLGSDVPCDVSTGGGLAATGSEGAVDGAWLGVALLILGAGIFTVRRRVGARA